MTPAACAALNTYIMGFLFLLDKSLNEINLLKSLTP